MIKSYLRVGTLHIWIAAKRLGGMLANQRVELNDAIENQRSNKALRFSHDCFKEVIYKVSNFAMDKILKQLQLAEEGSLSDKPCSRQFTKSWGLPCSHYIRCCLKFGTPILLQDIPKQWLLDKNPMASSSICALAQPIEPLSPRSCLMQKIADTLENGNPRVGSLIARLNHVLDTPEVQVNEPLVVVKKRGRPARSKNKTSITRDKSHFEYVEGSKCGICKQSGHNSRTCTMK